MNLLVNAWKIRLVINNYPEISIESFFVGW